MIKSVIFDLDGTLTDSYEAIVTSFEYALREKGIKPIEDEKVRRSYIGPALVYSYEKNYDVTRKEADELVEIYRKVYRGGNMYKVRVYDGVEELLKILTDAGFNLFVATSKPKEFAEKVLEKVELSKYFKKIQAPDFSNCEQGKDVLINSIINEFSLLPQECIMVGDTRFDIEGGKKAGVSTIGVTYGYPSPGDFDGADYIINNPLGIKDILLSPIREIPSDIITDIVAEMCIEANCNLNSDIENEIKKSIEKETSAVGKNILGEIELNAKIARNTHRPMCQDTGMVLAFVKLGQDVHITGDTLNDAINKGVAKGYKDGYMRCSVVSDPILRENTGDNTPAIVYTDIVPGKNIEISVMPKGFGSENMSAVEMLKPSASEEGVKEFVIKTVKNAGANPCPPIVVGVGIGGSMDKAALLSKQALIRGIDTSNSNEFYKNMEEELLDKINLTGIGPAGFGGKVTALGVNIETYPTHIAGLPVAVTISCHATRHKTAKI